MFIRYLNSYSERKLGKEIFFAQSRALKAIILVAVPDSGILILSSWKMSQTL
jgi:hypothetical protein